jgi:hypothetical protein
VCISQDLVALRLDHVAVRKEEWLAVKLFLYGSNMSSGTGGLEIRRARRPF